MKIVLFTPAVIQSAIARVSTLVVRALREQGHDVTVVRSENRSYFDNPTFDFGGALIHWDAHSAVDGLIRRSDVVVYQIGNFYDFHRGCIEWLGSLPGIVCLHDYFLGDLFFVWSANRRTEALEVLRLWYGEKTANAYFSYTNGEEFRHETSRSAPMTEWIASMASGVIVHSGWDVGRLLNACPGPVYSVPLPYDQPSSPEAAPPDSTHFSNDFVILTIGHINPNKHAEAVIRAIGKSSLLREKAVYRLVGRIEQSESERLLEIASDLAVRVSISGEVSQAELRKAIDSADVMACLRFPALESASASAIESMLCGKAVIVLDTGFYAHLPDNCVRKIQLGDELRGLQAELEFLFEHENERRDLGRRAAEWAQQTFVAMQYASEIIDISTRAAKAEPIIAASRFFGETLAKWGGVSESVFQSDLMLSPLAIFDKSLKKLGE